MFHDGREALVGRLSDLAGQVTASMGMEVVLVEIKRGGRSVVRVYIDQPGGISLDDCERFSRRFSALLDVEDCIPFSYVLEASSPGLERPLVGEADFVRFAGRRARLRTSAPFEGQRNFQGRIVGASEGKIRLEVAPGKEIEVALAQVDKANLVAEI